MTPGPVRTVLFDALGTLVHPARVFEATYAAHFRELGAPDVGISEIARAFAAARADVNVDLDGVHDRYRSHPGGDRGFWRAFVGRVVGYADLSAVVDADAAFDRIWDDLARPDAWSLFDDVSPTLALLADAGFRLGLVSNWDSRLRPLLDALDLTRWLDPILVSIEEGIEKPNPEIFRAAARRAETPPAACAYVGDSLPLDGLGARNAGLRSFVVVRGDADTRSSTRARAEGSGVGVIESLTALPGALGPHVPA